MMTENYSSSIVIPGAQAGLSWLTVLKKREPTRGPLIISIHTVSAVTIPEKVTQLRANKGIIRNKRKIDSAINNAAAFLKMQKRFGSFDTYLRRFVGGKPIRNAWSEVLRIIFGQLMWGNAHEVKQHDYPVAAGTLKNAFFEPAPGRGIGSLGKNGNFPPPFSNSLHQFHVFHNWNFFKSVDLIKSVSF